MAQLLSGAAAPAFSLSDQDGKPVGLRDFSGKKLLLYFYPKADTPGCTTQACSIRDEMPNLAGLGIAAVGISPDKPEKLKKFREKKVMSKQSDKTRERMKRNHKRTKDKYEKNKRKQKRKRFFNLFR